MIRSIAALGLSATLGLASVGSAAAAASPPLAQAFGNTIVSTYPDGRTAELWLQPGGVYTAKGRRGDPSSGRWSMKGQKVCLKQSRPLSVPFSFCTGVPGSGVGASWTARAVTGETIRVAVVKGHFSGRRQVAQSLRTSGGPGSPSLQR